MSLADICADLRKSVDNGLPAVTAKLARGLTIVYEHQEDWRRLAIGRKEAPPSADEWATVSKHFDLPAGQSPERAWRHEFMVLELTWRDIQQAALIDVKDQVQYE